ncbi:MAG: type II toxin-antitoxin system HicB family antitoxin [Cyanobacteria bacterium]|nr:type II toxin-antitoxin system HicB family antitoxin [Cyanobacteriota bacterium]
MPTNTFSVTLSRDEDDYVIAECPEIPGCVSQGRTRAEAMDNIRDAIRECLVVRKKKGLPLTIAVERVEVTV